MKMRKFVGVLFSLVFCLALYSCPFEEDEAEPVNLSLQPSSSTILVVPGSSSILPSSSSVGPEPSILDCPPEDIAEYPVSEPIPHPPGERIYGWCVPLKLSVEELLFSAQGGVRCIAASVYITSATKVNRDFTGCRSEYEIVSDFPNYINVKKFKKEICPLLFTATKVDDRTLHISVNQNETGNERKILVGISSGDCFYTFTITQSAD